MKIKLLCLFTFLVVLTSFAQDNSPKEIPMSSDNAIALEKAGDIPVSLFTGQANINIPLTKIKNGPINVDISLSYEASGVKVAAKPTWVGLNWFLVAGGVINRKENRKFDEYGNNSTGYIDKYSALSASNWNTPAFLSTLNATELPSDVSPDEFSFNFNGMSGSFFLNHEGKWVVKSKSDYNFKISNVVTSNYEILANGSKTYYLSRAITSFTIIADDGVKYVFGNSSNAVEYSYGTSTIHTSSVAGPQYNIQTSAWYLTQIVAPTGQIVNFNFGKYWSQYTFSSSSISNPVVIIGTSGSLPILTDINYPKRIAVSSSVLESIESNNGVSCYFNKSVNQQNLPQGPEIPYPIVPPGTSLGTSPLFEDYKFFHLDGIQMKVNNAIVNNISLTYLKIAGVRNKLQKVTFLSPDGLRTLGEYSFEYNPKNLPAITSVLEDHWGYYSGKRFWDIFYSGTGPKQIPDESQYYQSRESDANFIDAEVLQRVKYPEGGFIDFLFEPHQYSKIIKLNESSLATNSAQLLIENQSSNIVGGGLRIKKISTYESVGSVPIVKEYIYNTNSINEGTLSSGILSMKPDYINIDGSRTYFNSQAFNLTSQQSPVSYTEVMEKTGTGYNVNIYSNQDNGYLDKPTIAPVLLNTVNLWYVYRLFSSLDLERGLLLNQKIFNNSKTLIKEVSNEYNSDPNRYNNCVRTVISVVYNKFAAVPFYVFNPYLKKSVAKEYFNGNVLTNQKEFEYDPTYRLLTSEKSTNSNGEIKERRYQYAVKTIVGQNQVVNTEMATKPYVNDLIAQNIIKTPLAVQTFKSGSKVSEELTVYDKSTQTSNLLLPKNVYAARFPNLLPNIADIGNLQKKITYDKYDDKGNVLQYTVEGGITVSNIWGYKKTQLIAKLENTTYDQVASYVSNLQNLSDIDDDTCLSGNCKELNLRNNLNTLRTLFPQAMVNTYTYNPLIGLTSVTDSKGVSGYYEYDSFGRLKFLKDSALNILQEYCYNYKGQQGDCSGIQYQSVARSGSFTKNNCAAGGVGSSIAFSQELGAVTSMASQDDADADGLTLFNTNGQANANANANGICTFSSKAQSASFTRNNCGTGAGSSVNYSQVTGVATSTISQADADSKGLALFNTNGQANANANGICTFSSVAESATFRKGSCDTGVGSSVVYNQIGRAHV